MWQILFSFLSKILSLKSIYTIILNVGLLQTFQWMSREANIPHLFLSTTIGDNSPDSAMQGAGSDLAACVSMMCLTPNSCLILLGSKINSPGTRNGYCHPYAQMFFLSQTRVTDPWVPATPLQCASSTQGMGLLCAFYFFTGPVSVFLQ